jgi:hypothetical protein
MIEPKFKLPKSYNFSLAFERMCSFVAIANTRNAHETLKEIMVVPKV